MKLINYCFRIIICGIFPFLSLNAYPVFCPIVHAEEFSKDPWSVRMANTVMKRYPVLTEMDIKFHGNSNPKWQYDIAMLAQSIDKLGKIDPKYSDYMKSYMDYFISDNGTIDGYNQCDYNLDKINPGNNLIILYQRTGEQKYKYAIDQLINQLEGQPNNPDGGFWHKYIYTYQMWLDGIYMSSPFMARYAREFNDNKWYDEVVRQITLIEKHSRDPRTGLLYHGYDESRGMKWSNDTTGCSPEFWGRSMGWFMMALVDVLDFLPELYPGQDSIVAILNRTSEALVRVRDREKGLWYQVLDKPDGEDNYLESTASCMITYAFAKGANKGYLDKKYLKIAHDSFKSILNEFIEVQGDGMVNINNACYVAGLGGLNYRSGTYDYYISEKKGPNDSKAIGPFIMMCLELEK